MNKKVLLISLSMLCGLFSSCSGDNKLEFEKDEYQIYSSEAISVKNPRRGIKYKIISSYDTSLISLDSSTGVFTFSDELANSTQVLVVAKYQSEVSNAVVVTLLHNYEVATVSFNNLSSYVVDGEFVTASASLPYSITYNLKEHVKGVSIDETTGKVSYTNAVADGTKFVVVANTHNDAHSEKEFIAMRSNFIKVTKARQIVERNSNMSAKFVLDFSDNPDSKKDGILALTNEQNSLIDRKYYDYDKDTQTLTIKGTYLDSLFDGVNTLKIITSRNSVAINVEVATKFIFDAYDLASINDSAEALQGYYVLMNDIDLSEVLVKGNKLYNDGLGWTPIGTYIDVVDGNIATSKAFKGTFDGNGHTISNLYANRKDTYSFNFGLFGYTTSSAVIKNLGVTGKVNVSSYSGGLVGSNSGTISNCYSDVDLEVYADGKTYRYVGGLVGNNFGEISNCYSVGNVHCDTSFGSFVGSNEGTITNCAAVKTKDSTSFKGYGVSEDESCVLFNSLEEMKNYDFSSMLSNEDWNLINGSLPSLKVLEELHTVVRFSLAKELTNKNYYVGDNIALDFEVYPRDMKETVKDNVKYEVKKNGGVTVNNNIISTLNAKDMKIEITASLETEENKFVDTLTINLGKKITSLNLVTPDVMKAGMSYPLSVTTTPNDAIEEVEYILESSYAGITIEGNTLTISQDCNVTSFNLFAMSKDGKIKSATKTIQVQTLTRLKDSILYSDTNYNFQFELPSVDKSSLSVKYHNETIKYTLNNKVISINKADVKKYNATKLDFIIEDSNGRYLGMGYLFNHKQYTYDNVKSLEKNVIEISSVEDFFTYFNINKNEKVNQSKFANYDKTFVLANDIDFKGQEIYGIGYALEEGGRYFSGKFYGLGHTVSNYVINKNEGVLSNLTAQAEYGVGLFAACSGEIYDLNIRNVQVKGKNFVGALVGILNNNGKIENCHVSEANVSANGYKVSSLEENIRVSGVIGRMFEGETILITYDGKEENIIG